MAKKKKKTNCDLIIRKWLEGKGWMVGKVEQTIPRCWIKRDLWNCADQIAVRNDRAVLIQATSRGHVSDRIKKCLALPYFPRIVQALEFFVVGHDQTEDGNRFKVVKLTDKALEVDEV